MTREQSAHRDVHADITRQIIAAIEADPGKPSLPWQRTGLPTGRPVNIASRKAYNGINVLALWVAAEVRGYSAGVWGTYRQWGARGCQVKKGEKGSLVVLYKDIEVQPDPEKPDDDGKRSLARASWVFNADQVEGYQPEALPHAEPVDRIAAAEAFIRYTGADIRSGGDQAFFRPRNARGEGDYIQMPDERRFRDTATGSRSENWYAVELHELVHWSGDTHRLARTFGKRFADNQYAAEELVAEIGAAFLCADLRITPFLREDHAPYVAHWLALMKGDNRAVFTAAAAASRAVAYLYELQPPFDPDPPQQSRPEVVVSGEPQVAA